MVKLFYCDVSSVNYGKGTANVTIKERENQVVTDVPILAICYEMPNPCDTVAVIFEESDGRIEKGVILGKIFSNGNRPGVSGAGIFYKEFSDGSSVTYRPEEKSMEITAKKIVVDEVEYKKATQKG